MRVSRVGIWAFELPDGELRPLTRFDRRLGTSVVGPSLGASTGQSFHFLLERVASLAVSDTSRAAGTVREDDPLRTWILAEGVQALLLLPIRIDNRLVGMISCEETGGVREWSPRDRDLAVVFAHQAREAFTRELPSLQDPLPPPLAVAISPTNSLPQTFDSIESAEPVFATVSAMYDREVAPRLSPSEGGAILAGEEADGALWALEVQAGYLSLLEEALADRPEELILLGEMRSVAEGVGNSVSAALRLLRSGMPAGELTDLSRVVAVAVPQLVAEGGDRVRLLLSPGIGPLPIRGDAKLIERALLHLVRSVRITSPEGERVRLGWGRVPLDRRNGPEAAVGLEIARIRVAHRRAAGGPFPSELKGGSLPAFVHAVIEGHGGWIEWSEEADTGTTIDLYLPLALPIRSTADARAGASISPRRILLVEDEPLLARLIERTLSRSGFTVETVASVGEAERIWRHLDRAVDLVIVERTLTGGVSGIDVAHRMRMEAPGLPLIVLDRSGDSLLDSADSAAIAEFPILLRPFEPADVLREVRGALQVPGAVASPAGLNGNGERAH